MSELVLFVDDDENILNAHRRNFRKLFDLKVALGGDEALEAIKKEKTFAVAVVDMQMPEMNGIELLQHIQKLSPDTVRVMLTGNADQETAVQAVNEGQVFQFLTKPCLPDVLSTTVKRAIRQHQLLTAEKELLQKTLSGSVHVLTEILSITHPAAFGRGKQLKAILRAYFRHVEIKRTWDVELAAMLSQIGLVTMPIEVVQKQLAGESLANEEKALFQRLPEIGAELVNHIPRLKSVAKIILYQKKHYNGSGFPHDTISKGAIPYGSKLIKILNDILELGDRKLSVRDAIERMQTMAGVYDPVLLDSIFEFYDSNDLLDPKISTIEIPAKDVLIGHVLGADVKTQEGALLIPEGTEISQFLTIKLKNFSKLGTIQEPITVIRQ